LIKLIFGETASSRGERGDSSSGDD
jgi:TolA-binding protein